MSNNPFSRNRVKADLIAASPAIGILTGLVLGGFFGWFFSLDPTSGSIISGAGIGLIVGLLVGIIVRAVVACHEHGTGLTGFLPASWDHLGCQSWDHPARLVGGSCIRSLTRHVACSDVEVIGGIQGGQCG